MTKFRSFIVALFTLTLSLVAHGDTIDACTEACSDPNCFEIRDCQDMCGDPYCPGGALAVPNPEFGGPLNLCCPRGMSAAFDDSRGVWICTGDELPCPDPQQSPRAPQE
jgi:hypothetical protein